MFLLKNIDNSADNLPRAEKVLGGTVNSYTNPLFQVVKKDFFPLIQSPNKKVKHTCRHLFQLVRFQKGFNFGLCREIKTLF